MLTEVQINKIKDSLNNSQNPLFLFDNDQDGLCSFLLLQRYLGRGKGFPIKTIPLDKNYIRKVNELNPDYIFILDIPDVSSEFFDEIHKINLPIIWIDHHKIDLKKVPSFVDYYNPFLNKSVDSATTALCYEVTERKEDLWIAVAGCISDRFLPPFYSDFSKEYSDLAIDSKDAFDVFYSSGIGRLAQIIGLGLKDRTTNVIKMIKFLRDVKTPYEVLEESPKNREMHEKFKSIHRKYEKFLEKAKANVHDKDKFVFFEYGGDTSMSSEIANGLKHFFKDKLVFVAFVSDGFVNLSGRGEGVKVIFEKALEGLEGAKGGGHDLAVGGRILRKDLDKFKKRISDSLK